MKTSDNDRLTCQILLDAGVDYGHTEEDNATYAGLVFGHSATEPCDVATAGIEFLEKWGAFHYTHDQSVSRF